MEVSAPEKVRGALVKKTAKIVDIPTQETMWREGVVRHTQQVVPSHTTEQATPPASQPIPDSSALRQVGAERIGVEPPINLSDVTYGVSTLGTTIGGVSPDTYDRTISGHNVVSLIRKRARRFFRRREAA